MHSVRVDRATVVVLLPVMNQSPQWVQEEEAEKLLRISNSTIRLMRRERKILPGKHWILATGSPNGPVHYDITAIQKRLVELTIQATKEEVQRRDPKRKERQASIETYSGEHLTELIAAVQS